MPPKSLDELRAGIDRLDRRIVDLLNQRASLAAQVGALKHQAQAVYFTPDREKRVYKHVLEHNPGPLDPDSIRAIYREIISSCLALERPLRVACLGPAATFSHAALLQQFGSRAEAALMPSLPSVFAEVEHRRADYGIVPVENSTHGVVAETLDGLAESNLRITAEILLRVEQCLLSRSGQIARIKKIVSHPQSLGQCRLWLAEHLPDVAVVEAASNAAAAAEARKDASVAAIAGSLAASEYGLKRIASNIQDEANNFTRFFVISHDPPSKPSGDDKTTLLLAVHHEPGALFRVLKPFSDHGVSLCSIESRPLRGQPWEYSFFLDLVGHADDPNVAKALHAVARRCENVRVLGSYPAALRVGTNGGAA